MAIAATFCRGQLDLTAPLVQVEVNLGTRRVLRIALTFVDLAGSDLIDPAHRSDSVTTRGRRLQLCACALSASATLPNRRCRREKSANAPLRSVAAKSGHRHSVK
jgi:hypothetical protein